MCHSEEMKKKTQKIHKENNVFFCSNKHRIDLAVYLIGTEQLLQFKIDVQINDSYKNVCFFFLNYSQNIHLLAKIRCH